MPSDRSDMPRVVGVPLARSRVQPSVSSRSSAVSPRPRRNSVGVVSVRAVMPSRVVRSAVTPVSTWKRPAPTTSLD
jgi:hypothetical protein